MLAQQRASGALEISGNPGGTVFLSGGYLCYAESPAVPDLGTRLIRSRRLSPGQWDQVIESDRAHGGVGALLVSREVVTRTELRDLLWSTALDALIALTLPGSAGPLAAGIRFWPRRSHWVGSLLRLDTASVWADAEHKADLLAEREIPAEACPRLCRLTLPGAVVNSEQWAIAWQFDGLATVRDLAWRNGLALYDTMERVGDLVQAGLCTVTPPAMAGTLADPPPDPASPPASASATTSASVPKFTSTSIPATDTVDIMDPMDPVDPVEPLGPLDLLLGPVNLPLPQRKPGVSLPARPAEAETDDVPQWHAEDVQTPQDTSHPDLLHRILRGLRRSD